AVADCRRLEEPRAYPGIVRKPVYGDAAGRVALLPLQRERDDFASGCNENLDPMARAGERERKQGVGRSRTADARHPEHLAREDGDPAPAQDESAARAASAAGPAARRAVEREGPGSARPLSSTR